MVIVTAETMPTGESTVARVLAVGLKKSDVDMQRLTHAQGHVDKLPHAMSGHLNWLRPQMRQLGGQLRERHILLRARFTNAVDGKGHLRLG